ncbi:hypothetical protein TD95_005120 [Thielaviopsis punctulata]|uniref:Uncharacterized protein n=1 Tax=Thielaviopsis punctulata TaxID=72032 RepID=A0A0F4ZCC1_9PEZI|nr:hypothetical protein TD95_005120 [Thielaviopsis punctulata]
MSAVDMDAPGFNTRARTRGQTPVESPPALATTPRSPKDGILSPPLATPSASPFIPTARETAIFAIFPALLLFGGLYSVLSPTVNVSTYDPVTQSHSQHAPPSYFAHKKNIFNRFFVKIGWAWVTAAAGAFAALHPALGSGAAGVRRRLRVGLRYAAVSLAWMGTTQWFFGPPLIDRSFRWSGGMCHPETAFSPAGVLIAHASGVVPKELAVDTATACRRLGGRWYGGHDISGHVFLLVLGAGMLLQEVGWAVWPCEKRALVNREGEVVHVHGVSYASGVVGPTGKFALGVVGLKLWMLLMTAIYFHTWFEKFTGLLTATVTLYVVYVVPRFAPTLRSVIGVPGLD